MKTHTIVSSKEWDAAWQQLLVKEKELTRARDALAAERRRMPWLAVEKTYVFNGPNGKPVASLLACQLETGRTHQIRVHLAHAGHPLLGDSVYGPHFKTKARQLGAGGKEALTALGRQALHAYLLALEHPRTGELLHWEAGLPEDLRLLRAALEAAL